MKNIIFILLLMPFLFAGSFQSYTEKTTPESADIFLILDNDDQTTKKVQVGNIGDGINWYTTNINSDGINWTSLDQDIQTDGVNWNSLVEDIGYSGINWTTANMSISSAGNFGIGTLVSGSKLLINGSNSGGVINVAINNEGISSGNVLSTVQQQYNFGSVVAGAFTVGQEDDFMSSGGKDAYMKWFVRLNNNLTEYMRLNSSGSLALGSAVTGYTPSANLAFMSGASKVFGIERNLTSATAGNDLTIRAGGATVEGSISALNATPTAGGSGYALNDILTITTGGASGTARVTAIGGSGDVTTVALVNGGSGYTSGTGKSTSGGSGSGCTLNITTVRSSTDKNGGDLNLSSGVSTGTGTSGINLQVYTAGGSGTTDNSSTTLMTLKGTGNIGISSTTPGAKFDIFSGTIRLVGIGTTQAGNAICLTADNRIGYATGTLTGNQWSGCTSP